MTASGSGIDDHCDEPVAPTWRPDGGTDPPVLTARGWRLDGDVALAELAGAGGYVWESERLGVAGRGVAVRVSLASGAARQHAGAALARLLDAVARDGDTEAPRPLALAALPFDPAAAASVVVPALQVRRGVDGARWLTRVGRPGELPPADGPAPLPLPAGSLGPTPARYEVRAVDEPEAWKAAVAAGRDAVRAGRLRKVVLARAVDIHADVDLDQVAVLRRLARSYPSCFRFAVDGFVGASPELLVARHGDVVRAQPMAGTAPRVGDPAADAQLAARLLASAKDRTEHQVTIDTVESRLLPFCSYLDAQAEPAVVSVANVQHLATLVDGRLSRPLPSVLDLVAALHPTPAVGGDPPDAALALIAGLETHGRGRYAGPVGWVDADGDGEFAVGIRSAELSGRRARLYAGVGVVADSEPEAELEETRAKLQAMLGAVLRP